MKDRNEVRSAPDTPNVAGIVSNIDGMALPTLTSSVPDLRDNNSPPLHHFDEQEVITTLHCGQEHAVADLHCDVGMKMTC